MATFTYRNGRYFRDGEPFFFVGVDYQYYRDKRSNWADRLAQIKAGQGNVITFYVPWRHHLVHDPKTGAISYDFRGETLDSRDLIHFIDLIAEQGLYAVAKPGPFVHSELNIGGLPDVTSPSFNPEIEPVRVHDGRPLYWEYDYTQLPSPYDERFFKLAEQWLAAVGEVLAPYTGEAGPVIGIQLLDETIYCSSNDAPWHYGYDAPNQRYFHQLLRKKYKTIHRYNALHGTEYRAFELVPPVCLKPGEPVARRRSELLRLVDWAEFQWRVRRDAYALYKKQLGIDLPYLSNFAGITPPIEENVPDAQESPSKDSPGKYLPLYPEWWFAHNRVDLDAEVYHYGMISWLGVAAYNIADAGSEPGEIGDNEVFNRYINTSRRRRGINVEENWGFSKLYHPLSEYPIIPFFQTLASIAGGCTGYVVFTGVCHGYWTDDLDRTTQKQFRTFPADAPIGENGETGPMYAAMKQLGEYFAREGGDFLRAELEMDVCFLIVPEYAAVSSWVPGAEEWALPHAIPRVGTDVLEPATHICNTNGINYEMAELPAFSVEDLLAKPRLALHLGFFLPADEQEKLVQYVRRGGQLILSGELPQFDEFMKPCTVLADCVAEGLPGVHYNTGNIFRDQRALLANLRRAGWQARVSYSPLLRAFVYRSETDTFVLFFNFDREGPHEKTIEFDGLRLDLTLGAKTCGVVRVRGGRIRSYLIKGVNEFEGRSETIVLGLGDQEITVEGDGSGFDI
ncbi:MAG: beta-galactosidase [Candidatus Lernaella stagnicola]|nr:beta-galactosidase [Candidatus Lernaella stagnicola]